MAGFQLCGMPFALKILYSAFIDSTYITRIGRRKTWIGIGQFGFATILTILYFMFDTWLEEKNVMALTVILLMLYFFISCQDVGKAVHSYTK